MDRQRSSECVTKVAPAESALGAELLQPAAVALQHSGHAATRGAGLISIQLTSMASTHPRMTIHGRVSQLVSTSYCLFN